MMTPKITTQTNSFGNVCKRCGSCCKSLAFKGKGLSPEVVDWLKKRGANVDGDFLLIPHICQHLKLDKTKPFAGEHPYTRLVYSCDIHDTDEYPLLCRRYHGHGRFYIPEGCVYATPESEIQEKLILEDAEKKSLKRHHNVLTRLAHLCILM